MSLGPELIFAQAEEINKSFAGNRIRKVEAADRWLALIFSANRSLFFSWDPDFYGCSTVSPKELRGLTEIAKSKPAILNAVKSHIAGTDLLEARALCRDRILSVEFRRTIGAGFYQKKYLLLEASGKYSNLMLLDENEKILEAAKHIHPDTNRYRSTLPGLPYTPPPPLAGIPLEDFNPGDEDSLTSNLEKIVGVGRPLLHALKNACLKTPEHRREILAGLGFFKAGGVQGEPVRYFSVGGYVTLYPSDIPGAQRIDSRSALEAARATVASPLLQRVASAEKKKLFGALDRQLSINTRKIRDAEACLASAPEAEKNLLYGRLILANTWTIPPRASAAELSEWTDAGEVTHSVELDPEKDASANAERYFAKYRKRKASAAHAEKALPALYAKGDELQEQLVLLDRQDDLTTLALMALELEGAKPKHAKLKSRKNAKTAPLAPHARYELDCAALYVGLSARGNHYVTRLAGPDDIWLHAQNIPGAHVILRFDGNPDDEAETRAFETAAACAAYYSKGRESGAVRVDYTERKHVRAIPGGGLAHVTYKEFGTIMADVSLWEAFLARKNF